MAMTRAKASQVTAKLDATGSTVRGLDDKLAEFVSVKDFSGVDPTGATDSTAGLIAAFSNGGRFYVPEGDYLIAGTGPDSGGVIVTLTKSLHVECHPRARFFTNNLDNDFFRFGVPSNGAGLPATGIDFEWRGGLFDQQNQKNSLVVPFIAEYPPSNLGSSNTAEAIYIEGSYDPGSGRVPGINSARVIGATFISGEHWQTAGGDGHIFMGGCRKHEALYCYHRGSRDSGFYSSSDATGTVLSKATAIGNVYENCFVGAKQQRSAGDVEYIGNTFINCPRAMAVEWDIGSGAQSGHISGNTGRGCGIPVRLTLATGFSVTDNHFTDAGALLADGTSVETFAGLEGFVLRGCTSCVVRGNTLLGMKAAAASAYPSSQQVLLATSFDPGTGAVQTTGCRFQENLSDGFARLGNDSGSRNTFIDNEARNAVVSNMSSLGANSVEVRVVPTTGQRNFNTPVGFADGSASAPTIARAAQANTGIYFGTNRVSLAGGAQERISVTNTGIGFFAATPVARPVYITPTGTASRATFDTTTVTTQELAERVKAIVDDFKLYGLFGGA
jgi:hypothetical protein